MNTDQTMNSEKFSLKWNDFQQTVSNSFKLLRLEETFFDVTLVSDDERIVKGHKVVLSACSDIFKLILKNSTSTNSFIYLPGISSQNLEFIMDYIYQGEISIYQDQLDEFLEVAEKLKIAGLMSNGKKDTDNEEDEKKPIINNQSYNNENEFSYTSNSVVNPTSQIEKFGFEGMDTTELDEKISEMISVVDGIFTCSVCSKTSKLKKDLKKHIELHFEGLSFPCMHCDKSFRSRNLLQNHISRFHKNRKV